MRESSAAFPHETGGILIGKMLSGSLMVTRTLGPGPRADHGTNSFRRDGDYSQQELDKIFTETNGREDYVGEWHSHPARCKASGIDVRSIEWISRNSHYGCADPVLIISVPSRSNKWDLFGHKWSRKRLIRCPIEIVEIPQGSNADR